MFGDLITQKWARDALPVIIEHAKADKIIRYKELQLAINATTPRKMGNVCAFISTMLHHLEHNKLGHQWQKEHIPRLTNIVVRTNGKPGEWMCEQITGDRDVAPPGDQYKEKYVMPVFEYQRWDDVLEPLLSMSMDKALENLDVARRKYYEVLTGHWTAKTPSEIKTLQRNTSKALDNLSKAEREWVESIRAYCRCCRPNPKL
jgi:hypothetical protein